MRALVAAIALHAVLLAFLPGPQRSAARELVVDAIEVDDPIEPVVGQAPAPTPGRAVVAGPRGAPRVTHAAPAPRSAGEPPPPAAQAAPVVTAAEAAETIVTDNAPTFPGGVTQIGATSPVPQRDERARADGVIGGTGAGGGFGFGGIDLSKPARLGGNRQWPCRVRWTTPADVYVRVRALVTPQGTPLRVELLEDAGGNIVEAARPCAMRERYTPGTDRQGLPTTTWTQPFRIVVLASVE